MTEQPNPDRAAPGRGRRAAVLTAAALGASLLGALATTSLGQAFGPPWHAMGGMGGPLTQAQIEDRADRMVRHVAIEIDANAEQQSKLEAIVKSAIKDILPMREKAAAARQQARDLFAAPTIDRAAIEKLRTEQIANADAFSKRLVQALADAADVLTPDQRKKLNAMLPPAGGGWRPWWHHG
jgi:protein CpxP